MFTSSSIRSSITIWILFAILLSACAAAEPPLQNGEVIGLFRGQANYIASTGQSPWTSVYQKVMTDGYVMTIWVRDLGNGVAFACQKSDICDEVTGYLLNRETMAAFVSWLQSSGFRLVKAGYTINPSSLALALMYWSGSVPKSPEEAGSWFSCLTGGFGAIYDENGNCLGNNSSIQLEEILP